MSYIWRDYNRKDTYELGNPFFSQFLETAPKVGQCVEVNPLIRFAEIFRFFYEEVGISEADKQILANAFLHYLALLDRKCGAHLHSVEEWRLDIELREGKYGEEIRALYVSVPSAAQQSIVQWLRQHKNTRGRVIYYREVVQAIFPGSIVYYYRDEERFVVYLPVHETEEGRRIMQLVRLLFMDVTAKEERLFWYYHFGIVGAERTMRIGNIAVY